MRTAWHLCDLLNGTLWPDHDLLITVSHLPWFLSLCLKVWLYHCNLLLKISWPPWWSYKRVSKEHMMCHFRLAQQYLVRLLSVEWEASRSSATCCSLTVKIQVQWTEAARRLKLSPRLSAHSFTQQPSEWILMHDVRLNPPGRKCKQTN